MSYDVSLVIDTGGAVPAMVCDVGNMTWNVGGMFTEALGFPLRSLSGTRAEVALERLTKAVSDMEMYPQKYTPMNPSNGWGDYDGALDYLRSIRDACRDHPKASVLVE